MAQALTLVRRGGTVVLVGITPRGASLQLPLAETVLGARTIIGSYMGSTHLSADVSRLVLLYQGGQLKLDELISGRYPLERINEPIASSEAGEALRNVIVF
jgi:S-(hydroxymethyl)glutathione dehydrogenase / alcohol dehydrogenase